MIQILKNKQPASLKTAQTHYKVVEKDLPRFEFSTRVISDPEILEAMRADWNRLSEVALRSNPFFDPDFLLPALQHFGKGSVDVLVIEAPNRLHPDGPRVVCALMPIVKRRFYGLPLTCVEVWKHHQCFDCTPLIRQDCAAEVLHYLLDIASKELKASLFSLETVTGDGAFQSVLTEVLHQRSATVFHRDSFNRACFVPLNDAETFIRTKVSSGTRKNTLRLEKKLGTQGDLEVLQSAPQDDPQPWINAFLDLEQAGWKGKNGTALASTDAGRDFFTDMIKKTWPAGRSSMVKIEFDGRAVGMMCNLHQGRDGAAFKIAFDESLSEYSPGLITVFHNTRSLHDKNVTRMDSCAVSNHSMINRVWPDRIRFQSLVVATGGRLARLATAVLPVLQYLGKSKPSSTSNNNTNGAKS